MPSTDPIFNEPDDVSIQLAALHLSEADIHAALAAGVAGMRRTTPLNPGNAAGFYMWSETNAGFAEVVLSRGWDKSEDKNLPVYENPNGDRIIVTSGDDAVGDISRNPDVRNTKGPATGRSVEPNLQLPLFNANTGLPPVLANADPSLWMLLFFVSGNTVHSELSLPRKMSPGGKVERWGPRIIVPSLNVARASFRDDDDEGFGDTADIPILRR